MTTLLFAMFIPVGKALAYMVPVIGLGLCGDSFEETDHERYSYIVPRDCGSESYRIEDDECFSPT